MSWRSHNCKPILPFSIHYFIHSEQDSSGRHPGSFIGMLAEVSVDDCEVMSMCLLRPYVVEIIHILFRVYRHDIVICDKPIIFIDEINVRMLKDTCLVKPLHYLLHPLGLLGMNFLCLMLKHESVIDDSSFFALHLIR